MKDHIMLVCESDTLVAQRSSYTESQQMAVRLQAKAIEASCNDPRPNIAAETVFAEFYVLIDDIEAKQSRTGHRPQKSPSP
ncbi:MAG: hypothetical protein KKC24_06300 [Gammaproteobacteria bacterium]|uniref:hypothetical protein n=1 Tax=Pseudomonas TaxID=286 RepID=UPI00029AAB23|nr:MULTISPECIES: hypothetical protein [Pseudomonas]MBU0522865.1 hypothetical protein [Gammaproteobacteria bacterium]MBU0818445.1 hypothetical protein [Gammaproteobacteria bacterium]MBU0839929.1 hypothetical protein [Gammaproteobacteria bacterium]MBU1840581.1 hypothetical protein [Gammaproteobacteria bacterium]MDI1332906.1 hypothetical protein [Pseudomonas sp.]